MDATRCIDDKDPSFNTRTVNGCHEWLFSYPEKLKPSENALKVSLTKETYIQPEVDRRPQQGRRKKLLEDFYRQLIAEELKSQLESDQLIFEDYETSYTEKFKNPDDMPLPGECFSKNEKRKRTGEILPQERSQENKLQELQMKYPLYGSRPLSFYAQATGRDTFRKKYSISKPIDQNYDNIEY